MSETHEQVKGEFPSRAHQFKPGHSGNPAGRPAAGACVREWFNAMADYRRHELEAVLADVDASAAKAAAARAWLGAMSQDKNTAGVPVAGADLDRICDRTEGKPRQSVEVDQRIGQATSVKVIVPGLNSI